MSRFVEMLVWCVVCDLYKCQCHGGLQKLVMHNKYQLDKLSA